MEEMENVREIGIRLLEVLGIHTPSKTPTAKVFKRLKRLLQKHGIPEDLNKEEEELVRNLLEFDYRTEPPEPPEEPEEEEGMETEEPEEAEQEEPEEEEGMETEVEQEEPEEEEEGSSLSGRELFRRTIQERKRISRKAIMKAISEKTGIKSYTVGNYISAAKGKGWLIESKEEDGTKILQYVEEDTE